MNVGKIDAITSSASSGDTLKRTVPFGSASVRKATCWAVRLLHHCDAVLIDLVADVGELETPRGSLQQPQVELAFQLRHGDSGEVGMPSALPAAVNPLCSMTRVKKYMALRSSEKQTSRTSL